MSDNFGELSRPRARPVVALPVVALAAVIVALLVAGVVGVAIHHPKAKAGAVVTPPGFQRVTDPVDHISLAVPGGWRVLSLTAGQLTSQLEAVKAGHPELASLLNVAEASLQKIQPGAFAIDVATRTTLFSYGVDAGGIQKLTDIPTGDVISPFTAIGAKNVHATRIHLPVGDAEQVSAELPVGTTTVTEVLDYFVLNHRVVAMVLASRSGDTPTALFHQIEQTLAVAPSR